MYPQFYLSMPKRQCKSEIDKQNPSNYTCSFPSACELSAPNLCKYAFGANGQIHTAIKYRGGVRKADNFEEASVLILDIDLDPSQKDLWSPKATPQSWKEAVSRYANALNASKIGKIRFYALPSLSCGIHLYIPLQKPITKSVDYRDAAVVLIEFLKSGDADGWHVDPVVKDAGRMILNGAVLDNPEEWIFENEGETWSYDKRKNYGKRLPELFSPRRDGPVLDLLTPNSRNNNLLSLACKFANDNNNFSYVLQRVKEEIDRQIAENTDPSRVPLGEKEVERVVENACTFISSSLQTRPLASSSGSFSLGNACNWVRKSLRAQFKIAPQDSANPDERRLIYRLTPSSSQQNDRGYAEPISEDDYKAEVSKFFWEIQSVCGEEVWQKLNRARNLFDARVVLDSEGLRVRNPNETFFSNGVFNSKKGQFEPLAPGEYLIDPLAFPYTEEPCNGPFKDMLNVVFDRDCERIALLRNAVRSSLTYDSGEAMAVFLYGGGATGKSKLMEVFEGALGNRFRVLKSDFLTEKDKFALSYTRGAYMVVCNELGGNLEISNTALKRLASNDLNSFESKGKAAHFDHIRWKPFIILNILPPVSEDNDDAVFRRVCIIEFRHKFDRNIRFEVTVDLVEDCRRWICEAVRSKSLKAEEWNNLPIVMNWKRENSVDYVLCQVLWYAPGKYVTLTSLRKRLKDGDALPKKVTVSPRAFRNWVAGSHDFVLGTFHNQDALKDAAWIPDSDLVTMTEAASFSHYPMHDEDLQIDYEENSGF